MWMILNCCFLTTALGFLGADGRRFNLHEATKHSIFHFFQRHLLAYFLNSFTLQKVSTGFYQLEVLYFKICIPMFPKIITQKYYSRSRLVIQGTQKLCFLFLKWFFSYLVLKGVIRKTKKKVNRWWERKQPRKKRVENVYAHLKFS